MFRHVGQVPVAPVVPAENANQVPDTRLNSGQEVASRPALRRRSDEAGMHSLYVQQQKNETLEIKNILEQVEEDNSFDADRPPAVLRGVDSRAPSFRHKLLLALAKASPYSAITYLEQFALKGDKSDLDVRKEFLDIVKTSENGTFFNSALLKIERLKFTQEDSAYLAILARSENDSKQVMGFISSLRHQASPVIFPEKEQIEFAHRCVSLEPFKISNYEHEKRYAGAFYHNHLCKSILNAETVFDVPFFPIPPVVTSLLSKMKQGELGDTHEIREWLSFCALVLPEGNTDPATEKNLEAMLTILARHEDPNLRYNYMQILHEIFSRPQTTEFFFSHLSAFRDPRLFITVLGGLKDCTSGVPPALLESLASLANSQTPGSEYNKDALDTCLFLGQDKLILDNVKLRLVRLCLQSENKTDETGRLENFSSLGRVFEEVTNASASFIGQAYMRWLPVCNNVQDLHGAARNSSEFVKKIMVSLIKDDYFSIDSYLRSVREPHFPRTSKYTFEVAQISDKEVQSLINIAKEEVIRDGQTRKIKAVLSSATRIDRHYIKNCVDNLSTSGQLPILVETLRDEPDFYDENLDPAVASTWQLAEMGSFLLSDRAFSEHQATLLNQLASTILKFRAPEASLDLMLSLGQAARSPQQFDRLERFVKITRAPHMQPFLVPLSALCDPGSVQGKQMLVALSKSTFKDIRQQLPVVLSLSALALSPNLGSNQRGHLLTACLEADNQKKHTLLSSLGYLESLARLADLPTETGNWCLQQLQDTQEIDQARESVKNAMSQIFVLTEAETEQFVIRLEHHLLSSRKPTAFLTYVASLSQGLSEDEYRDAHGELTTYVRTAILADDPAIFRAERYDLEKSEHLTEFSKKAPNALKAWIAAARIPETPVTELGNSNAILSVDVRKALMDSFADANHVAPGKYTSVRKVLMENADPVSVLNKLQENQLSTNRHEMAVEKLLLEILASNDSKNQTRLLGEIAKIVDNNEFKRDLRTLKSHLAPSAAEQPNSNWTVFDTDDPQDLFLAGTEISGSCQSVYGSSNLNQALMGYVLDGKYRMIAVKDETGRTVARRMMRLMWNMEHISGQRPVIQLERLYANPGIKQRFIDRMNQTVASKANAMGADVMSCETDLPLLEETAPLTSLPTKRPREYVDANRGIERSGDFTIDSARMVQILFPQNNKADVKAQ